MMKMKLRELNNGRLAMVAITAMVAQELNTGINLIPADEVLGFGVKGGGLKARVRGCLRLVYYYSVSYIHSTFSFAPLHSTQKQRRITLRYPLSIRMRFVAVCGCET